MKMKSEFSEVLESPRKANKKRFLKLQLMIDTILETKCNVTLLLFDDTYWRGKITSFAYGLCGYRALIKH